MKLTKKIKIKINQDCKDYLEFASERCRLLYNFALADKIKFYKENKKTLSMYDQKKGLPKLKEKYPDYAKVYNKCLSVMFFRLNSAYEHFFGKTAGFPKFKRKGVFVSQEYQGMYIKKIDDYRFRLPTAIGNKPFIVRTSEKIPENYGTVTIVKQKNHYFACFIVEETEKEFKDNGEILAIDLGIKTLVTGISTKKEFVQVAKFSYYTKHLDKIKSKRDKCKKRSRRWKKHNELLQKRLQKYQSRANDYLHKSSHWLTSVRSESTLVVGKLNLESMKTDQSWFNRVIQNEWRVKRFVGMLKYKSKKFGKQLIEIDESYTTQECSRCGKRQKLSLKDRTYVCSCGLQMDRDRNSTINILKKYCTASAIEIDKILMRFTSVNNLNVDSFVYV
jgi:putative transposase